MEILIGCLIPSLYSAYTDATKRLLYDYITIPIFLAGLTYSIYSGTLLNHGLAALGVFIFLLLFAMATGGIAGGDVKFITALAVWFGYPNIIYVVILGSILSFLYGCVNLHKMGLLKARIIPFFKGIYYKVVYGVNVIPKNRLPEDGSISAEAVPMGPFLVVAAWVSYFFLVR